MEAVLLRLENNQVEKVIGNVRLTLECKQKSASSARSPLDQETQRLTTPTTPTCRPAVQLLVHEKAATLTHSFNLRSCYLYPDRRDPRLVHVHRGPNVRQYGEHTDVLQFATIKLANDFLVELRACSGQSGPTVNIESLHDQTGPKIGVCHATATKRELLSVDRVAGNHQQTSSIHSNVSDLSQSATSSGYCSHHWSEISSSSQLVDCEYPATTPGSGPASAVGPALPDTLAENTETTAVVIKTGDSSTPVPANIQQQDRLDEHEDEEYSTVIEEKVQRCKYCNKQFDFGDDAAPNELCRSAPNTLRESLDRFCCVQCYKGAWYHLTKDTLDDEGQDIGRCAPGGGMTTGYWCLLGFLSVVCAPCLVFWCPLNMCELASQHAGLTGGPHSLTTIKKKTTMVPNKRKEGNEDGGYASEGDHVITEQPGESSHLEPLTVRISLPPEDDEEEYNEEDAEQERMMGYDAAEEEHVRTARGRVTPHVQRAQSELVPDRREAAPLGAGNMVQRSMSEGRG